MASAKKLPSGSWRVQVVKVVKGKKVKKSFTESPEDYAGDWRKAKAMAEKKAREWSLSNEDIDRKVLTVSEAIDRYNASRERVLSPSTMPDYYRMKKYFVKIHDVDIHDVTTDMIQNIIGDLAVMKNRYGKRLDKRTIKNRIFYLLAVFNYFELNKQFKLAFPPDENEDNDGDNGFVFSSFEEDALRPPEKNEFKRLLDCTRNDEERLILMLAGLYTLRRGEIAGLTGANIIWDMHCIQVKHSRVLNTDKEWVNKSYTKNKQSSRTIEIDPKLMSLFPKVGPKDLVISKNPNQITKMFGRIRKEAGVSCRFHDLRKFAASIRSEMMSAKYVEADGGWKKDSTILQSVYNKAFRQDRHEHSKRFNKMIMEDYGEQLLG